MKEPIYTYRITRKIRLGGSTILSVMSLLTGLLFLLIFWPVGVVFFILACLVTAKHRYVSFCGHCGNEVAHTSCLCPSCHADLAPEPHLKRWWRRF